MAGAAFPLPREAIEGSIPERFAHVVARFPARAAIEEAEVRLTYRDLDDLSNRWAHLVLSRAAPGSVIALFVPQGVANVAATLGILKAGALYAPFDPDHPVSQIARAVAHAGPSLAIAAARHAPLAAAVMGRPDAVVVVGEERSQSTAGVDGRTGADSLAYLFFTSGSTGTPKGVVDSHRNVIHNVWRYTSNLGISETDRLSLIQPPSFSGCVSSQFCALLNGATLLTYDLRRRGLGRPLREWIQETRVSVFHSVPAIFRSVIGAGAGFPDVRVVRIEGDAASARDAALFRRHFDPGAVLANGLGSTETGLACQYRIRAADAGEGSLPIGFALPDMEVAVVDEEGNPVGDDAVGELAVRSRYLAVGYWNDPDRTREAFRSELDGARTYRGGDLGRRRSDGAIEYVGRKNFMMKVRGEQVDVAAVERALVTSGAAREAAVVTLPDRTGEARVVAYVVASEPFGAAKARRGIVSLLPASAVPTRFVRMDSLPLNENGKVDRGRLPPFESSSPGARTPAGRDLTSRIAILFEDVLDVRPVGPDDDFFDLGGDSLGAARVVQRLETEMNTALSAGILAEAATARALALRLRAEGGDFIPERVILREGGGPTVFLMYALWRGDTLAYAPLARHLPGDPLVIGLQRGSAPEKGRLETLEEIAGRYWASMKARQPEGPYRLVGYCFGGVVALEITRLGELEGSVVRTVLLDVSPFDFPSLVGPEGYAEPPRGSSLRQRLPGILARLRDPGRARYVGERLLSRARELEDSCGWLFARLGNRLTGRVWPAWLWTPLRRNRHAFVRHRASSVASDLALILGVENAAAAPRDLEERWRGLTGGRLTLHVVGGANGAMLEEPHVRTLAATLGSCLD